MCNQEHTNEMKMYSGNTMCQNSKYTKPKHNTVLKQLVD